MLGCWLRVPVFPFGLTLAPKSTRGYDATDKEGVKYQIKATGSTSRQLSPCRGLDKQHFDFMIGIVFASDFGIKRACCIPHATVMKIAKYREGVNGWVISLRDPVWEKARVKDITAEIKMAAGV